MQSSSKCISGGHKKKMVLIIIAPLKSPSLSRGLQSSTIVYNKDFEQYRIPTPTVQLRDFLHVWWAEITPSHSKLCNLKTVQGFQFLVLWRYQCSNINLESRLEESSSSMHFRGARLSISVQLHVIIRTTETGKHFERAVLFNLHYAQLGASHRQS